MAGKPIESTANISTPEVGQQVQFGQLTASGRGKSIWENVSFSSNPIQPEGCSFDIKM